MPPNKRKTTLYIHGQHSPYCSLFISPFGIFSSSHFASPPPRRYTQELQVLAHQNRNSTEGECCFVKDMTEVSGKTLHCNKNSTSVREQDKAANNTLSSSLFVNYAAIAWEDSRRRWIGERPQSSQRIPKDPVISWSLAYDDLLASNDPFPQPIPLPEMVDFLVDIWHEDEGLVE